ncbi:MAG: GNAT family N-acetyltransferase [Clostridia bacterium]|nr:GNAT family N-acetyltransferase [Clostridia bacterium]
MQIRKATKEDIESLGRFYDKEVMWMDAHDCNYPLWTYKGYPTEDTVRWAISEGTQFICLEKKEIIGSFMLNTDPLGAYDKLPWSRELKQGEYMILHMFCVSHQHTGKGIGKQMVRFCVEYAKAHGYKGIRLDVVPTNLPAKQLFFGCGFHYIGDFDLEKGVEKIPIFSMYEYDFSSNESSTQEE